MQEPDSIDVGKMEDEARAAGFSIFEGIPDDDIFPEIEWMGDDNSFSKFLLVAKASGKKALFMMPLKLTADEITGLEASKLREAEGKVMADLEKRVGQYGAVQVSWLDDGAVYTYFQYTAWYRMYVDIAEKQMARSAVVHN